MSFHVDLTAAQAQAIAQLAQKGEVVSLRQLVAGESSAAGGDVYATVHGSTSGFRISPDGSLHEVAHVLPAP
jgi:hypothetical protein